MGSTIRRTGKRSADSGRAIWNGGAPIIRTDADNLKFIVEIARNLLIRDRYAFVDMQTTSKSRR
jgi:hypothetical protein